MKDVLIGKPLQAKIFRLTMKQEIMSVHAKEIKLKKENVPFHLFMLFPAVKIAKQSKISYIVYCKEYLQMNI